MRCGPGGLEAVVVHPRATARNVAFGQLASLGDVTDVNGYASMFLKPGKPARQILIGRQPAAYSPESSTIALRSIT